MTLSPRRNLDPITISTISYSVALFLWFFVLFFLIIIIRRSPGLETYILLINRSLFTGRPFFPSASRGVSVHISLTFSSTMLQCRSKAFTRASSLRLLRIEMRTWVCDLTAVWRMERGPEVNSCSSSSAISYSLWVTKKTRPRLAMHAWEKPKLLGELLQVGWGGGMTRREWKVAYVSSLRGLFSSSLGLG